MVNWTYDETQPYDVYAQADIEGNLICIAPEGFEASMLNWPANRKLIISAPKLLAFIKDKYRFLNLEDQKIAEDLIKEAEQWK